MEDYEKSVLWLALTIAEYNEKKELVETMRFPQYVFNKLSNEKPNLIKEIVGTSHDFYYDTFLTKEKWLFVGQNWSKYDW